MKDSDRRIAKAKELADLKVQVKKLQAKHAKLWRPLMTVK
jgi:hypothetical protein